MPMSNEPNQPPQLTHLDERGNARMVDVGGKAASQRMARARATVQLSRQTAEAVVAGNAPKGDVLATARLAGIMAAKRCFELIPLAHPIPISFVDVEASVDTASGTVTLIGEARTAGQTGIEMEAMTACAVAALTVYDMVKGIERGVKISCVELLEKTGGKHDWQSDSDGTQS